MEYQNSGPSGTLSKFMIYGVGALILNLARASLEGPRKVFKNLLLTLLRVV